MAEFEEDQQLDSLSVGERLRAAREERGMTLDDVANRTRIPIRHLKHIEKSEWDALPALTYSVGFARTYASTVGLDGSEIGKEVRELLGGETTYNQAPEYHKPADPARVPPRSLAIVAAAIAVALVIGYTLWRSTLDDPEAAEPVAAVAPGPAPRPAPPPQPLANPQAATGLPVTLTAAEEVWLRIDDEAAAGPALFQGILQPGQRFQVPPTAGRPVIRTGRPQVLRVTIGNSEAGPLEQTERTISGVSLLAADLAQRLGPARPQPQPQPR